jgi:hypothetical protein
LPAEQARLAEAMSMLDRNLFANPSEVRACLDSLEEDGLRPFNFDYYYMNLLAIFGNERSPSEIRKIATACNKFRLWSRWECYSEPFRSDTAHGGAACKLRLRGWQSADISSFLEMGRGLVVYTSHYGAFRRLYQDLALMGCEPWISVDADSAEGFRRRSDFAVERLGNEKDIPPISQIERVVNVEHPLAAVRIAGLLKRNEVVIVFADGNGGLDGPWGQTNKMPIEFLGYPIAVKAGVVKIAAALGSPILPVLTKRTAAMHQATVQSTEVGEVQCGSAMIPPLQCSDKEREAFARNSVEAMFAYLQQAILEDPTQWESACLFHRWRGTRAREAGNGAVTTSEPITSSACPLPNGLRFRLNEDRVATVPADDGAMLVNVRTLRVFHVKKRLEQLVLALGSTHGLGSEFCGTDHRLSEGPCELTRFLTALQQLGLVHKS